MVTYCWTYRTTGRVDGKNERFLREVLHLAIRRLRHLKRGFVGDDAASAMTTSFAPTNASIT
jgi:hypothetical protein